MWSYFWQYASAFCPRGNKFCTSIQARSLKGKKAEIVLSSLTAAVALQQAWPQTSRHLQENVFFLCGYTGCWGCKQTPSWLQIAILPLKNGRHTQKERQSEWERGWQWLIFAGSLGCWSSMITKRVNTHVQTIQLASKVCLQNWHWFSTIPSACCKRNVTGSATRQC